MTGKYRRREILAAAGSTGIVVIAGCSGGDDTEPADTAGEDGDDGGDGTDDQTTTSGNGGGTDGADGALYADDHLQLVESDDGYVLNVPDWPDGYVGTASQVNVSPEDDANIYPVQYDESDGDGVSMENAHDKIVTPGFDAETFVAPFVWGDGLFPEDDPWLRVIAVPPGESNTGHGYDFDGRLPEDSYTRIEDSPLYVAHIDPTQYGWSADPDPEAELWIDLQGLAGEAINPSVKLTYQWQLRDHYSDAPIEEGVPPEDADPRDLLPSVPDGWEQVDSGPKLGIGSVEGGYLHDYMDPNDDVYYVSALRFESEDAAANFPSEWQIDSPVYVTRGHFGFNSGYQEIDDPKSVHFDRLVDLLSHSPALTEEYVRNNNLNQ